MFEAGIATAGTPGRFGIHFLQITQNGIDRGMQTVKIHPVKAGRRFFWINIFIEPAQPLDELDHDGVAPHPGRKTAKSRQRFVCVCVITRASDVAMDSIRVRPVRFDCDHRETFLGN